MPSSVSVTQNLEKDAPCFDKHAERERVKLEKTQDAHTAFVTLSAQLAVIISDISPMFPPGEPETTNNKGKTFLTNPARSIDAGAAAPFTGRLVLVCLVFCRSVSLLT